LKTVYLALGSNLGDREQHLRQAIAELGAKPDLRIVRVSKVYETAPQGYADQGWFLNMAVEAETSLMPMQLLSRCLRIERTLKRQRQIVNGPRTIDIDIIFYAHAVIRGGRLQVPHPRYAERRFVLQPLADLNPELRDPVTRKTVAAMLAAVKDQPVRQTGIVI
jgi:2-amino-4-hydroxy-6-hydroxymethyldihydropteridine diphosphokinase